MNCRPSSATNGNCPPLIRNGHGHSSIAGTGIEVLAGIVLIFLASCLPASSQNTAGLTIQGIMPATQRLSISPIQTTIATDQVIVTLDAKNNFDAGYAVTIQSKVSSPRTITGRVACQLKCDGRSLTLAPGTVRRLSEGTKDRSARTVLQISNPSALSDETFTLTVICQ